jgi:hypothetical protein
VKLPAMTLEQKLNVVSTVTFVAVAVLIGYTTVGMLKTQRQLRKRLGLDGDLEVPGG